MRRLWVLLLGSGLALSPCSILLAKDAPADKTNTSKDEEVQAPSTETAVRTKHSVSIGGHSVAYTATAGTLVIRDDKGQPQASVFYVAYTVDNGKPEKRPVTFLYNGGPGSS